MIVPARRALLGSLLLAGCAAPWPPADGDAAGARALLDRAADAHGRDAFRALQDIAVSYAGEWPPIVDRLQPALVDRAHRERSEERLLPRQGVVAQAHRGPGGIKYVLRRPDAVRVWFDGRESADAEARAAAALVADGYALFLLGPLWLTGEGFSRASTLGRAGAETLTVDGERHPCDVLLATIRPGLGFAAAERLALWIDRERGLMRRVRFSLDGLESTRGAIAEVDAWAHVTRAGVAWPTRFRERLLRPVPLRVHDWWLTGLDVDRGVTPAELAGPVLEGRAAAPATAL